MNKSIITRFWAKVDKRSPKECWEWNACLTDYGYGSMATEDRNTALAHRVSWQIHFGEIPEGMCILHKCDNPPCVNPSHLFMGDRGTNNKDRDKKGRSRGGSLKGETNPASKLTKDDVVAIRELRKPGRTYQSIADKYGIAMETCWDICNRRTWRHVK